jgi:two-component system response regulator YesN
MNVLVVDDEPIIRVALRSLIDWESNGLTWLGEAENGAEAWELIETQRVDLLITDLLMPIMDGLELLRKIKESNKDMSSIVLSCMDDFNWVKEAMKLGAKDYILKPTMEPEQLVEIVLSSKAELKKQREERESLDKLKEQIELSKQVQLTTKLQAYLQKGSYAEQLEAELFGNQTLLGSLLLYAVPEISTLSTDHWDHQGYKLVVSWSRNCLLLLYPLPRGEDEHMHNKAAELQRFMDACVEAQEGKPDWFVGLGLKLRSMKDIAMAADWHGRQLHHYFYDSTVVKERLVTGAPSLPEMRPLPYESRNDLLRSLAHDNEQAIRYRVQELGTLLQACNRPQSEVVAFMAELLALAIGYVQERGYAHEVLEAFERKYVHSGAVQGCATMEQLVRLLIEAFEELGSAGIGYGASGLSRSRNPFIKKAVQFMREHYHRNISTLEIAEHVRLSRSYLSDLFSKEMGESLSEALTLIRMEEAKHRLRSGEMKVYEVAEAVGFPDAKSFAKTFKRMVGCSPKEFENSQE